jgi:hypothetical protein
MAQKIGVIHNPLARQPIVSHPVGSTGLNSVGQPKLPARLVRIKPIVNPLSRQGTR